MGHRRGGRRRWPVFPTVLGMVLGSVAVASDGVPPDYRISHRVFRQPLDHWNGSEHVVTQQVDILVPTGDSRDAPVFFHIGATSDLGAVTIAELYRLYRGRTPIIFVEAEHRGYGQSVSDQADQTRPSYVRIDQALADAHNIVTNLKEEFPGPWMAAGYSQGGGVAIDIAATYPEDVSVVLASSGVLDAPLFYHAYDEHIKTALGERVYRRLVSHTRRLDPGEPFDDGWRDRELLIAVVKGVVQYREFADYRWVLEWLSHAPTDVFITLLEWLDEWIGDGAARTFVDGISRKTLTREQAITGGYNWRMWRYQQCTEVGTLDGALAPDGLLFRTREEYCRECRILFDEAPFCDDDPGWSPRRRMAALSVPLVFVSGGLDPWLAGWQSRF